MQERLETELYTSIATLDQLKKLYDLGAVDIRAEKHNTPAVVENQQA